MLSKEHAWFLMGELKCKAWLGGGSERIGQTF